MQRVCPSETGSILTEPNLLSLYNSINQGNNSKQAQHRGEGAQGNIICLAFLFLMPGTSFTFSVILSLLLCEPSVGQLKLFSLARGHHV